MPHAINIDGISESLFLLQSLAHASPSFCQANKIKWENEPSGDYDWDYYFGWLKSLTCEHLIQVSTKLRMLEDILRANEVEIDISAADNSARDGLSIGAFVGNKRVLTLRESWNKVIHATDTQLEWEHKPDHEYWTGAISLFGKKGEDDWKVTLHIDPFVRACTRFMRVLEEDVDWHHLYKHDR
jgi:hypothetical protein